MKNKVYQRLFEARTLIRETKIKKEGRNSFSNYDYFTPSQVASLVSNACKQTGLIAIFDLKKDELGHYGELRIIDIESGEVLQSEMRTDIPEIKATNIAQQLGGTMTYTKRYMLMNAFDIEDNNLDFDTPQKPTEKKEAPKPTVKQEGLSQKQLNATVEALKGSDNAKFERAYNFVKSGKGMTSEQLEILTATADKYAEKWYGEAVDNKLNLI